MKIYLVGGAVRDTLLGIQPKDKDWVVVGATEEQMINKGFKKITASFPVFINPETKDEYALARAEKKVGYGYHAFKVDSSKNVTLKKDLERRDITINSIALDRQNNIIDPFNGQQDIVNKVLRHTSIAFTEDPLRVIRLARFMAQLSDFSFSIAPETKELAKQIARSGELDYLKRERLYVELIKALKNPKIFFETLGNLNSLEKVFPKILHLLPRLHDNFFFKNPIYINAENIEKITLTFIKANLKELNHIKKELLLTNKQFKLLKATIHIKEILENVSITAKTALILIKEANILRDRLLFEHSYNLYMKYILISAPSHQPRNHYLLKETINNLRKVSIEQLTLKTPKNKLHTSVNKLYTDTIKKHLNI